MLKVLVAMLYLMVPAAAIADQATSTSGFPVYPSQASGLSPLELGNLLLALTQMPKDQIPWDFLSDSPGRIAWQTEGVNEHHYVQAIYDRNALVRVHVENTWATVLKKTKMELAWRFDMQATGSDKFGANQIEIGPGSAVGDGPCFGSLYRDCSFNPLPSMLAASLKPNLYCSVKMFGANFSNLYVVNYQNKPRFILEWTESSGSGGESTSLMVYPLARRAEVCAKAKSEG